MKASICAFAFALRQGSPMGILAKLSSPLSRYTSLLTGQSKVGGMKLCCKKYQVTSNHRLKGQLISKCILVSSLSSKKRMKTSQQVVKFVRLSFGRNIGLKISFQTL